MDRLWRTDGDFCMLVLRVALGAVFFIHGSALMTHLFAGGPALPWVGGTLEFIGSLGLLAGFLVRVSAGGLLCEAAAGLIAFGNRPPGRGAMFYCLAGALCWIVLMHGAGPFSIDSWLTRHVAAKRV